MIFRKIILKPDHQISATNWLAIESAPKLCQQLKQSGKPKRDTESHRRNRLVQQAIITFLQFDGSSNMEAEHLNSIAYKLDDIAQRAAELRRYL